MAFTLEQENPQGSGEYVEVQMGLSSGEVRQALLDRVREDSRSGNFKHIATLQEHVQSLARCAQNTDQQHTSQSIEDLLYDHIADEDLYDSQWQFLSETIRVVKA